jgi:hypothetical protein
MWRMYVRACARRVCVLSRASDNRTIIFVVCNLQFLFDFNLTLGYTYGVRVDKEYVRD